ncbi:MAG: VOC family protein [Chloroflexota bacterium]|nr:VOC family protein [Chloroflexota bacterium]
MFSYHGVYPIIPAHDVGRARRFYEEKLGLKPIREVGGGVVYGLNGAEMIFLYGSAGAGTAQHTIVSFLVQDLRAELIKLRAKGVTFEEYDLPGLKTEDGIAQLDGEIAAWFKDSEGNIVAVSQVG